jgi:hypothetical protein
MSTFTGEYRRIKQAEKSIFLPVTIGMIEAAIALWILFS